MNSQSVDHPSDKMRAEYHCHAAPDSIEQVPQIMAGALELKPQRSSEVSRDKTKARVALPESRSRLFQDSLERARQAASTDTIIFLKGETGVGKNVLAHQIHEWSQRRNGPFVTVKCGTPSETLYYELFGHKTDEPDLLGDKPGRLAAAHDGTLFLDEVADLPFNLQTEILRFIVDGLFEHIGGNLFRKIDARIIAATSRDLEQNVEAGEFRSELYYHLDVVSLNVPPLRERMEDLIPLAEQFLAEAALRRGRSELSLSEETKRALATHQWPGNILELRNVIERAAVLAQGNLINRADLPQTFDPKPCASLEQIEEQHIRHVLSQTASMEDAASMLGIGIATLWRKRKRYRID